LDGGRFPDLIPEVAVWSELASELRSGVFRSDGDQPITPAGKETLLLTLSSSEHPSVEGSDDILVRRDASARLLSISDLQRINEWLDARRQHISYTFPMPGKLGPPDAKGVRRCTISVKGSEHPLLVPETFYWEFYFRSKVDALGKYGRPDGTPVPIFTRTQQRYHLPMPTTDVELFFQIAKRVVDRLEHADLDYNDQRTKRRQQARIVRQGREELIRRLPASSWRIVQTDAHRVRQSTIFDFPTGL
jgi:hypothetical protein